MRRCFASLQGCRAEIDGKSFTPDRNRLVLRQIQVATQGVILVADIPLDRSQIDEISVLYRCTVFCIGGGDQVHVNIGAIGRSEVREAQNAISVLKAVDGCSTRGGMHDSGERARLNGYCGGSLIGSRKRFVDPVIGYEPIGPKRVPCGEQHDGEYGKCKFPLIHFWFSLKIKILTSRPLISVAEYAALVVVMIELCTVGTDPPASP